jgi:hypothetical protein
MRFESSHKKNYKSQFSTNLILKNKIEKRKPISKTEPKKKKRIRTKSDLKINEIK